MHSFHQSRGRILFEAACALMVSASFVGAWMDLGVQAFLAAAAVSALYGLVRLFDMRGRKPPVATAAPAAAMMETDSPGGLLTAVTASGQAAVPAPFAELEPVLVEDAVSLEEPAPAEVADSAKVPKPTAKPRARKPRSSRKATPIPVAGPMETVPVEVADSFTAETDSVAPETWAEPEEHMPVTPLFEPEPFVRMPRPAFGRKAG